MLPLLLGATAACGGEGGFDAWCNAPGQETSILFLALAFGVIAAVVVAWARKRGLEGWDLRESASAPSPWTMVGIVIGVFVVSGVVFSLVLSSAENCAPAQRTANLWFTWLGILLATAFCLLGLLGANRSYERGAGR